MPFVCVAFQNNIIAVIPIIGAISVNCAISTIKAETSYNATKSSICANFAMISESAIYFSITTKNALCLAHTAHKGLGPARQVNGTQVALIFSNTTKISITTNVAINSKITINTTIYCNICNIIKNNIYNYFYHTGPKGP